jgi:pimeloyl-ACP methyl ester carboxylesterase
LADSIAKNKTGRRLVPVANVRGVNIVYKVIGDKGPWLALVTGGRRDHSEFVDLAGLIAKAGFRVVLHDRRNTGASDVVIAGEEGEEAIWADDLHALLGQLGALPCFIGGASSGSRTSLLFHRRHPEAVRALLLMQCTGGAFAAGRLPENYYGQYIRAAETGGMAAVCATEMYKERIAANPDTRERMMAMDPAKFIEVMKQWLAIFMAGPKEPLIAVGEDELRAIKKPVIVIPGNDKTHSLSAGLAVHKLIPGAQLFRLPIEDQDVPVIQFAGWKQHEPVIADALVKFMHEVQARA